MAVDLSVDLEADDFLYELLELSDRHVAAHDKLTAEARAFDVAAHLERIRFVVARRIDVVCAFFHDACTRRAAAAHAAELKGSVLLLTDFEESGPVGALEGIAGLRNSDGCHARKDTELRCLV